MVSPAEVMGWSENLQDVGSPWHRVCTFLAIKARVEASRRASHESRVCVRFGFCAELKILVTWARLAVQTLHKVALLVRLLSRFSERCQGTALIKDSYN